MARRVATTNLQEGVAVAAAPPTPTAAARARWRPYLLVAPSIVLTIWVLYPFAQSVWYSLHHYVLSQPWSRPFVGLRNYQKIFTDPDFLHTVAVTLEYTLLAVAIELLLGMLLAFLLNRDSLLTKILRPLLILPLMVAPAIGSLIWKLETNPQFGFVNFFMSFIGQRYFPWGSSPRTALLTVVLVDVWIFTPFIALLLLAGLRSLPQQPFEAARLDGAGAWFTFRTLTLPMLMPYILIAVMFRILDSLQQFDIIYAMTQGGPGDTLMTFQLRAYLEAFTFLRLSESAALILVLWVITYAISYVMVRYWNRARAHLRGA